MPRLLTSTSVVGTAASTARTPSSVDTSPTAATNRPCGTSPVNSSIARATESALRPLTATPAPARASPAAIARPMPWVEPVTSAVFPLRSMLIMNRLQEVLRRRTITKVSLTATTRTN